MTENHGLTDKELRLIKSYNIIDLLGDWFLTKKQKAKIQEKADKINERRRMKREKEISSSAWYLLVYVAKRNAAEWTQS